MILIALKLPQPPSIGILAVLQMPHMVSTIPNGVAIWSDHIADQPPRKAPSPSVLDSSSYHEGICPGPRAQGPAPQCHSYQVCVQQGVVCCDGVLNSGKVLCIYYVKLGLVILERSKQPWLWYFSKVVHSREWGSMI